MGFNLRFEVPDKVRDAIRNRLYEIEATHDVRILYAAESGSRACGFAPCDSDYYIRFIYVQKSDWYLKSLLNRGQDTIGNGVQHTPVGNLIVYGWDLVKALDLYRNSNASIFEWLASHIVYLEEGNAASRLFWMRTDACNPSRLWQHYNEMVCSATKRFEERRTPEAWLCILRPLLMTMWVELYRTPPPIRLDDLVDAVVGDTAIREAICEVVEIEKGGNENDDFTPSAELDEYVLKAVMRAKHLKPHFPEVDMYFDFGQFFRQIIEETWEK